MWVLFGSHFHVLQLLPIRFTQQVSCCISKSTMKRLQKPNWKSDIPLFSYDRKHIVIGFLINWVHSSSQFLFIVECRVVIRIPISFKHVSL